MSKEQCPMHAIEAIELLKKLRERRLTLIEQSSGQEKIEHTLIHDAICHFGIYLQDKLKEQFLHELQSSVNELQGKKPPINPMLN